MKSAKILAILVVVAGWVSLSNAAPMGTAWTYQGRLLDTNGPAEGIYDFEFKLYDDPCTGTQQGGTIEVNDLDITDGYFTVELGFGSSVFDGDARWLQIGVRPGDSDDTVNYTILVPRQELTPTPYALYAKQAGSDNDWGVSGNDMYSIPPGNVGIGTSTPEEKLTVVDGTIKCTNSIDSGWAVHGEATGWYGQGIYGHGTSYGGRGVWYDPRKLYHCRLEGIR